MNRFAILRRHARAVTLGVASAAALLPLTANAQTTTQGDAARAERLALAGRCEEAVPLLAAARAASPGDARIADLMGQCLARTLRWNEAVTAFEAAKALDPEVANVDLNLAISRFHTGNIAGARNALNDARARTPDHAEVLLYDGLIRLELSEAPRPAAELLERARARDAERVEPVASFYAAVAWQRAGDPDRAKEAFARVKREAPGTEWARAADRVDAPRARRIASGLRDRRDLEAPQHGERPLGSYADGYRSGPWFTASGGLEYDDNVVLRGRGVRVPDEIRDEDDGRGVWTAQFGSELWRDRDWAVGALVAYYGSAHFDLDDFDVHYPSLTVWIDRNLGEAMTFRLQYDLSHAWVGRDSYLREHSLLPALFYDWGPTVGTTRLSAELSWDDYKFRSVDVPDGAPGAGPGSACPGGFAVCSPFGLDERNERDRDGFWSIIGLKHTVPVDSLNSEFSAEYRFHHYDAEGREYTYDGHQIELGARTLLPQRITLDVQGSFTYRPYRHASTFPDDDDVLGGQYRLSRSEKVERVWQADVILSRPINRWLTPSIRYAYQRNSSNVRVFDYERHIVGAYLTFSFDSGGGRR